MSQVNVKQIPEGVTVEAIRKIEKSRNGTIGEANKCQVVCQGDSDKANTLLRKLTAAVKMVKTRFVNLKAPATETLRQIRALEADILAPLEEAKRGLNNRLMDWRTAERQRIAEAQAKADEKRREREALEEKHAEKGHDVPGPEPVIETPAPLEVTDTTKVRVSWEIEIADINKVPQEYIVINEASTRANVRKAVSAAEKGEDGEPQIEIPGVNIFQKETPVYA